MFKHYALFTLFLCMLSGLAGQDFIFTSVDYAPNFAFERSETSYRSTASCGEDTLVYPTAKSYLNDTTFGGMAIGSPICGLGQLYHVPPGATVTISGMVLAAGGFMGSTPLVRAAIYHADPGNGLPDGPAVAFDTLTIKATEDHYANFASPVVLTQDFVLTVELMGPSFLLLILNDSKMPAINGRGEDLSLAMINGNWGRMLEVGPPGFDADFLLSPMVTYDLTAGFMSDASSPLFFDSTYTFTSDHSPLAHSRFFNRIAFKNHFNGGTSPLSSWNFGDGSPLVSGDTVTHSFASGVMGYTVTSYATIQGYSTVCVDSASVTFAAQGVGIEEKLFNTLTLYPNPAKGSAQLDMELDQPREITVQVFNLQGQQLADYRPGRVLHTSLKIDLTDHQPGIYLVQVHVDNKRIVKKLQVQ